MSEYTSSIINNYGDMGEARKDIKTLHDIIRRQGAAMLLHVIAEQVGRTVLQFKLNQQEVDNIKRNYITELVEAINERT